MSVAEQMGVRLQSTAHSVNIKERLDFSCAVFDADGGLIANAPHMPVHLGSMGESIKMVISAQPGAGDHAPRRRLRPQRPLPRRHPPPRHHRGHSRLRRTPTPPETPEPAEPITGDEIWFYVASRGHHAEIGGVSPGIDAGQQHPGRGGGGADRQLAAGRGRPAAARPRRSSCWRPPSTRPATRPPTWPTCAPRSPPTRRASHELHRDGRSTSGSTSCRPTWATCRRTPPSRSDG